MIVIDLYDDFLKKKNIDGAYAIIDTFLSRYGFAKLRGGVYLSTKNVDAVSVTITVEKLASRCKWFSPAIKSAKLLRVKEESDLIDAIKMFGR